MCSDGYIYPPLIQSQDMNYRDACTKYNVRRQEILNEVEGVVEVSCVFVNLDEAS